MPVGRPPKYETPEQMQSSKDGMIIYTGKSLYTNDFDSEKQLSEFLTENIDKFCFEHLSDRYVSHEIDAPVIPIHGFGPRTRRVDLYIKCQKEAYIIELKNPTNLMENRQGIGQILDYGRELENNNLILITTKFDSNTARTIKHFGLPIRYFYMNKAQTLEYKGEA